jgi:ribosomal protein S1
MSGDGDLKPALDHAKLAYPQYDDNIVCLPCDSKISNDLINYINYDISLLDIAERSLLNENELISPSENIELSNSDLSSTVSLVDSEENYKTTGLDDFKDNSKSSDLFDTLNSYDKEKNKITDNQDDCKLSSLVCSNTYNLNISKNLWEKANEYYNKQIVLEAQIIDIKKDLVIVMTELGLTAVLPSTQLIVPFDVSSVGLKLNVKIISINISTEKLFVSERRALYDSKTLFDDIKINTVYSGVISNVLNWGIFIELTNGIHGLLHKSRISKSPAWPEPKIIFKIGDKVKVIIPNLTQDTDSKATFSTKEFENTIGEILLNKEAVFNRYNEGDTIQVNNTNELNTNNKITTLEHKTFRTVTVNKSNCKLIDNNSESYEQSDYWYKFSLEDHSNKLYNAKVISRNSSGLILAVGNFGLLGFLSDCNIKNQKPNIGSMCKVYINQIYVSEKKMYLSQIDPYYRNVINTVLNDKEQELWNIVDRLKNSSQPIWGRVKLIKNCGLILVLPTVEKLAFMPRSLCLEPLANINVNSTRQIIITHFDNNENRIIVKDFK